MGINKLWRDALLASSRALRQDILKGRIFGFGSSSSNPSDHARQQKARVPSTVQEGAEGEGYQSVRLSRSHSTSSNGGRVRGMVANFERAASESGGSCSSRGSSPIDRRYNLGDEPGTRAAATVSLDGGDVEAGVASGGESSREPSEYEFANTGGASELFSQPTGAAFSTPPPLYDSVTRALTRIISDESKASRPFDADTTITDTHDDDDEEGELSVADLIAAQGGSWGAEAWQAVDEDGASYIETARRIGNANASVISPSRARTRLPVSDVFNTPLSLRPESPPRDEAPIRLPIRTPPEPVLIRSDERDSLALLDAFRRRLEEVERKLDEMETREAEREQQAQSTRSIATTSSVFASQAQNDPGEQAITDPTTIDRSEAGEADALDPTARDLPTYVLMVGLGVCFVVARVVFRKLAGKKP